MKQVLLGLRPVKFTDDKTNKEIIGTTVFTSFKSATVEGIETAKIFLSDNLVPQGLSDFLGCELDFEFNHYGKVVQVNI